MLVLVGPSACGKTQIVGQLTKQYGLEKLVTYTSRKMRVGEVNGKDYHFIDKLEFEQKIRNDFFIEYVNYNGNYYGTPRSELTKNKVVILEPVGLKHYIEKARNLITIVYLNCSKEVLRIRMLNRGDKEEEIMKRLAGDELRFNKEIKEMADLVIDTTASNIYRDAEIIYKFYMKVLNEEKN